MKAKAEWTARTEEPVVASSASKRDKVMGIGSSAKHQGQRSYKTALTGRRHDCTRPAKLKHCLNHLAKRAPSRHDATSPACGAESEIDLTQLSYNAVCALCQQQLSMCFLQVLKMSTAQKAYGLHAS